MSGKSIWLRLSDCDLVRLDEADRKHAERQGWRRMGGQVVHVSGPSFSDVKELAQEIAGPGAYAPDPSDYRRASLRRLAVVRDTSSEKILVQNLPAEG